MNENGHVLEDGVEFDILILEDEDGNEHEFELADTLTLDGVEYVALIPVFHNPDDLLQDSGELVIMKRSSEADDEDEGYLDPIVDPDEYYEISTQFIQRLEDQFDIEVVDADDQD